MDNLGVVLMGLSAAKMVNAIISVPMARLTVKSTLKRLVVALILRIARAVKLEKIAVKTQKINGVVKEAKNAVRQKKNAQTGQNALKVMFLVQLSIMKLAVVGEKRIVDAVKLEKIVVHYEESFGAVREAKYVEKPRMIV